MLSDFSCLGRGRGRLAALGLALVMLGLPLIFACADCFFQFEGQVVDCGTAAPVAGATITAMIVGGIHGSHPLPGSFLADSAGDFEIPSISSEVCGSSATLMVTKAGYLPLTTQVMGNPKGRVVVCLMPASMP